MRLGCIEYDILSLCFLKIKENHDFAQTPWYFCNFSRSICLNSYYKPPRLSGVEAHIAFMRSFRTVYRYPAIEIMLLAAVIFQVFSGIIFLIRGVIPPKRAASKSRINTSPAFSAGRVSLLKPSYAFALE